MVRSTAIKIIARNLSLNAGRIAALSQRAAEAGELPRACGRSVPDLAPIGLAKLLICAIADRGLGNAAESVREFAALRSDGASALIDLMEGWMAGTVSMSGLHSAIIQLEPASVSIITDCGRLSYGQERELTAAAHVITVPGTALREIVDEFRGPALHPAPPLASSAARISATAHVKA